MRTSKDGELQAKVAALRGEKEHVENLLQKEKILVEREQLVSTSLKSQLIRLARELQGYRNEKNKEVESNYNQLRIQYMAREEKYKLEGELFITIIAEVPEI
jgi:hypothetical protein